MVQTGLSILLSKFPKKLKGKKIGVLCHAASITSKITHILDELNAHPDCKIGAIFGPQHGLYGQTQDNMVEWEGGVVHPVFKAPVYSLYGTTRKPTPAMLKGLEAFVVDLQDVGARPYTYIWTVKLCIEACAEKGIPVWILDRPNPIAPHDFDGPMLRDDYHSFVGGAPVPLCHRMTFGELALFVKEIYFPKAEVNVVAMRGWNRSLFFDQTGLPWVLPSPNMPTLDAAIVYPGMVLFEATNASEGRGTTRPFELFGAPYLDVQKFMRKIAPKHLTGAFLRQHDFIPTFQKWSGKHISGMQIHVVKRTTFKSVQTTAAILWALNDVSNGGFAFKAPPYEYEAHKMPFDILAGSTEFRECIQQGKKLDPLFEQWKTDRVDFVRKFNAIALYPEKTK